MDFDQVAVNGVNSNKYRELLSGSSNILWGMPEKRDGAADGGTAKDCKGS